MALMKRYDLSEDGYRQKFRASTPETDESPDQFIVRLSTYLIRWLELSKTETTFEGLKNLIVKEQFINSCPKELAIHLREQAPETLEEIAKIADQYLEAYGKHVFSPAWNMPPTPLEKDDNKNEARNCKSNVPRSGGQNKNSNSRPRNQVSAGCLVQSSPPQATAEDIHNFHHSVSQYGTQYFIITTVEIRITQV